MSSERGDVSFKTYHLDVKAGERSLNRFEVRFASDDEAIEHSRLLAASLRHRHFQNQPGLIISVVGQANRQIHVEPVYPDEDRQRR